MQRWDMDQRLSKIATLWTVRALGSARDSKGSTLGLQL